MAGTSWRLGRIAGIEIRIDVSWTIVAVLIAYSFFARYAFLYRRFASPMAVVGLAIASAVVFFGSVLAHELAHSVVARARASRSRASPCSCSAGLPTPRWRLADPETSS